MFRDITFRNVMTLITRISVHPCLFVLHDIMCDSGSSPEDVWPCCTLINDSLSNHSFDSLIKLPRKLLPDNIRGNKLKAK